MERGGENGHSRATLTTAGGVVVRVKVDALGKPRADVACSNAAAWLANCVAEVFTEMRFPPPEGGSAKFSWSFEFRSGK